MTKTEKKIPVVEMFGPTIQGEGSVIGQQTYFIRFGLCDYKCTMCDSMHAVDPVQVRKNAKFLTQQEIYEEFLQFTGKYPNGTRWVTFSGGNPCIHDLGELRQLMFTDGWHINVETQGTKCPEWLYYVDSITVSPKGPGMGETTNVDELDAFMVKYMRHKNLSAKIVVFDQRDLDFAAAIFDRYIRFAQLSVDNCYLSLGNPYPPGYMEQHAPASHAEHLETLTKQYRTLFEDIRNHPVLSKVKFLPQWHVFVWGNAQGY